jgi:hypothetical protein
VALKGVCKNHDSVLVGRMQAAAQDLRHTGGYMPEAKLVSHKTFGPTSSGLLDKMTALEKHVAFFDV